MNETLRRQYEEMLRDNHRLTARVAELEAALKKSTDVAKDIMTLEEGETAEDLTGYSRGAHFAAKSILAALTKNVII